MKAAYSFARRLRNLLILSILFNCQPALGLDIEWTKLLSPQALIKPPEELVNPNVFRPISCEQLPPYPVEIGKHYLINTPNQFFNTTIAKCTITSYTITQNHPSHEDSKRSLFAFHLNAKNRTQFLLSLRQLAISLARFNFVHNMDFDELKAFITQALSNQENAILLIDKYTPEAELTEFFTQLSNLKNVTLIFTDNSKTPADITGVVITSQTAENLSSQALYDAYKKLLWQKSTEFFSETEIITSPSNNIYQIVWNLMPQYYRVILRNLSVLDPELPIDARLLRYSNLLSKAQTFELADYLERLGLLQRRLTEHSKNRFIFWLDPEFISFINSEQNEERKIGLQTEMINFMVENVNLNNLREQDHYFNKINMMHIEHLISSPDKLPINIEINYLRLITFYSNCLIRARLVHQAREMLEIGIKKVSQTNNIDVKGDPRELLLKLKNEDSRLPAVFTNLIFYYGKVLSRINPKEAEAYLNQAISLQENLDQLSEIGTRLIIDLDEGATKPITIFIRTKAANLIKLGRLNEAEKELTKVIQLSEESVATTTIFNSLLDNYYFAELYYYWAKNHIYHPIYEQSELYSLALNYINRSIRALPSDLHSWNYLYLLRGVLHLDKRNPSFNRDLGISDLANYSNNAIKIDNLDEVIVNLNKILTNAPKKGFLPVIPN